MIVDLCYCYGRGGVLILFLHQYTTLNVKGVTKKKVFRDQMKNMNKYVKSRQSKKFLTVTSNKQTCNNDNYMGEKLVALCRKWASRSINGGTVYIDKSIVNRSPILDILWWVLVECPYRLKKYSCFFFSLDRDKANWFFFFIWIHIEKHSKIFGLKKHPPLK